MVYRIVALGFAILLLSGCVVGRKHAFRETQAVLDYHGQPLTVGVQDLRPYVVSGDKDEDFAGLARSGYGIPYDIGTESNRPLAQEMADVIAAALRSSGATVKTVSLSPKMGRAEVIRTMTSAGTDQSLLLSVREWKTDTYGATGLAYDLELEALNAQGQVRPAVKKSWAGVLGCSIRSRIHKKWRRKRSGKKLRGFTQAMLPMHCEGLPNDQRLFHPPRSRRVRLRATRRFRGTGRRMWVPVFQVHGAYRVS